MADNTITIVGGLVRDAELKFLNSGSAAVKFTLAVEKKWKNKDGEWDKKVSFIDVVQYGKPAENVAATLKKGYRAIVQGTLEQRSWETDDGSKRYVFEVIAENVGVALTFVTATLHKAEHVSESQSQISNPANSRAFEDEPF